MSGTSMAAPHVAGVMALYLGESDSFIAPKDLKAALKKESAHNALRGVDAKTVNMLVNTNQLIRKANNNGDDVESTGIKIFYWMRNKVGVKNDDICSISLYEAEWSARWHVNTDFINI